MATYKINDGFHFKDGHLFCEDIKVSSLSTFNGIHIRSPYFVFSEAQIIRNVNQYKDVLDQLNRKYVLNYSMKANANPHVMRIFKNCGLSLTLVSGMELRFALECGFDPKTLVFNGNGKLDEEVALAVKYDVLLNIDSSFNMEQTVRICRECGQKARILLRINPGINPDVHRYISTGQEGSKFGLFTEELQEVLDKALKSKEVDVVGLHCHLGSTIKKTETIRNSVRVLKQIWRNMKEGGFNSLQYLNIGGGLGIDYEKFADRTKPFRCLNESLKVRLKDKEKQLPPDHPSKTILKEFIEEKCTLADLDYYLNANPDKELKEITDTLSQQRIQVPSPRELVESVADLLEEDMTLTLEPGRSLIADAGIMYSNVLGCKQSGDKGYLFSSRPSLCMIRINPYLVIDGSMTEIIRPCLYDAYHHIDLACPSEHKDPQKIVYDVVGPVCESADFLGKNRLLSTPHSGCGVAIFDVGAYCGSMASNYNLRIRPAEILISGNSSRLIRKPDTYEDMMRPYVTT